MTKVVNLKDESFDVYIGRANPTYGLDRSVWRNIYTIRKDGNREEVIQMYEVYVRSNPYLLARLSELRGKTLGCWCAPLPCHGDVLVKLLQELDEGRLEM